jgi:hypothetical protein
MGTELFGIDVASIVADAMGDGLPDVTIAQPAQGARTAGNLTGGRAAEPVVFTGIKGFWDDFTGTPPPGVELQLNDRKAVLIGDTVPPGGLPLRNAQISIGGEVRYVVQLTRGDPAGAVYEYLCRDRRGPDGA